MNRVQGVPTLLRHIPESLRVNQYANALNWPVHCAHTAGKILVMLDIPIAGLLCAVSTMGTLPGLAQRLREKFSRRYEIAFSAVGEIIFVGKTG